MLIKLVKYRVLLLIASTFLLCQCTTRVNSSESVRVQPTNATNPYVLPVGEYLAMAKDQEGAKKQDLLISAAGRMIQEGQWRQGVAILAQTRDLSMVQANEKNILLAKIDLIKDKPKDALTKLASIKQDETLPLYHKIEFHELLAQSYRALGNTPESINERIKLDSILVGQESQKNNRKALWFTLINMPQADLNTLIAEKAEDTNLQGWLQLASISRTYRNNPKSLLAALDQWQLRFNNHPANQLLPEPLDSIADKLRSSPKQIALLLPLSGPLSGPGNAIHDGFIAASKANLEGAPKIKAYDTNKGDIAATYQQAISEGAEYIVGPLTKSQVATVAAMDHPIPTLLLNDTELNAQNNSYSFGLSPTHEAIQVANKAQSKGYKKALIIAPDNDWGKDVTRSFSQEWQKNGGKVVDSYLYGNNDDLNKRMKDFLQITASQGREKQLKQLLGEKVQYSVNRRQDFDMIFLLAYPSKARQIMPLLKYYYAGDVAVFATSSVYSGSANALKDKDLDGLIFCDIPWVFSHQAGARNWPEQFNSYNRLYAVGMDSYALATQMNHLFVFPADGSEEKGILYLNPSQQVARVLEWGQFKQGLAHSIGSTA